MTYNLEQDMKGSSWFVNKVRTNETYAQNLYAALCNNAFQKMDVLPILRDDVWSCSWRYAGGIVADIRCEGDYLDWYCSGIRGARTDEQYASFVGESHITDEIREDLKQLGWTVLEDFFDDPI